MKELFIQKAWFYKLFKTEELQTISLEKITIESSGKWNPDAGPDFLEAKVKIGNTLWAGNIEVHTKSSDWLHHKHSENKSYSNIILHVVFEHDQNIDFLEERNIPTLELKSFIPKEIIFNYNQLKNADNQFIPCEKLFHKTNKLHLDDFLKKLVRERLEEKTELTATEFEQSKRDWEALLFRKVAYAFGLRLNGEAFHLWSKSFDYKVLRKIQNNPTQLEALFFGQAGFLHEESEDEHIKKLKKEYEFLKSKYNLTSINKDLFKFFKLRPANFPTIRIAQLASVYSTYKNLFSFLMGTKSKERIYSLFLDLETNNFWDKRYTLDKESNRNYKKKISKDLIDRIIINALIPIKYLYSKTIGKTNEDEIFSLLKELKPEQNKITEGFENLNLEVKNAFTSQAVLQLKKKYCAEKKCLNCKLGIQILKNV